MKICVIGLGYVGAVTAACLARDGHHVLGIDLDETKLRLLRSGRSPVIEEGIAEVTSVAASSGRLTLAADVPADIIDFDIIFVCVGTPSLPNGGQDTRAVASVSETLGKALSIATAFPTIVLRSTVPPGTTENLVLPILERFSGRKLGEGFGLVFQPEFLREGTSIKDFYNPPFTVVGSSCERSIKAVGALFKDFSGELFPTSFGTAEMLKLTCNAFHALKISFANEIGRLCQSFQVDSREVMELCCKDRQLNISTAYLRPGFAFGGSCLPKDLRAMIHMAKSRDIDTPVVQGVLQTNEMHITHALRLVMMGKSRKVGLVGLSFKAGTDDLRESPLVTLAELLIGKGYELKIFDAAVNLSKLVGANLRYIRETIPHIDSLLVHDIDEVIQHGDTLIIGQHHAQLRDLAARREAGAPEVVDLVGVAPFGSPAYRGICW